MVGWQAVRLAPPDIQQGMNMARKLLHSRYEGETQDGKKCLVDVYKQGSTFFIEAGPGRITLHPGLGSIEDKIRTECGLHNVKLIDVPYSPIN
jgi:hypothetical protein